MSRYATNVLLYRLKRDPAFRRRFIADRAAALAGADLTPEEHDAFVRWDVKKLDELGGFLHLLLSIPLNVGGPDMAPHPPPPSQPPG
jgi:hypothetical protein